MRAVCVSLLAAWLGFWATSAAAAASPEASEAFEAGKAAFAAHDYSRALTGFRSARDLGLAGPAVHYNLGVCYYKLADYRQAESTFRYIAGAYPAMQALAQYNLGLIALKRRRTDEAAALFRAALAGSDDETVRRLAARQLSDVAEAQSPRKPWLAMIDTRVGHDDNVLLLAEEIALPGGNTADSSFTQLFALLAAPLSSTNGFRIDGSFFAIRYPEASIFDQTVMRVGALYRWELGSWRAEAGPHFSSSTLDGDAFERRAGLDLKLQRNVGLRAALGVRYVHDEVGEGEERFAFIEGSRDWLELRLDRRGTRGHMTLSYAIESNDRRDSSVSPARDKLSFRYRHAFGERWSTDLELSVRESDYDELSEARIEELGELALGVTRHLGRNWQVNALVSVADNDSNAASVRYDRRRVSLGLSKSF